MGALDDQDALEWHAALMLSQLAALCELDEQAAHFPWRSCAAMSAGARAETLSAMRQEWSFCNRFIDTLQPGSQLHTQLGVTRYQPYRDLMIKAEPLHSAIIGNSSCAPKPGVFQNSVCRVM